MQATRYSDRVALRLAAAVVLTLGDVATGAVRRALLPDPDAVIVVGVGAAVFGPANLLVAMAECAAGDLAAARPHLEEAERLAADLGCASQRP